MLPEWNIKVTQLRPYLECKARVNLLTQRARQVSSVLAGTFVTDIGKSLQMIPHHPEYVSETSPTVMARKMLGNVAEAMGKKTGLGDPLKGAQKIYDLSKLPNPPFRLLLGKDSNFMIKEWLAQTTKEVDEYASWSDDVAFQE